MTRDIEDREKRMRTKFKKWALVLINSIFLLQAKQRLSDTQTHSRQNLLSRLLHIAAYSLFTNLISRPLSPLNPTDQTQRSQIQTPLSLSPSLSWDFAWGFLHGFLVNSKTHKWIQKSWLDLGFGVN